MCKICLKPPILPYNLPRLLGQLMSDGQDYHGEKSGSRMKVPKAWAKLIKIFTYEINQVSERRTISRVFRCHICIVVKEQIYNG